MLIDWEKIYILFDWLTRLKCQGLQQSWRKLCKLVYDSWNDARISPIHSNIEEKGILNVSHARLRDIAYIRIKRASMVPCIIKSDLEKSLAINEHESLLLLKLFGLRYEIEYIRVVRGQNSGQ